MSLRRQTRSLPLAAWVLAVVAGCASQVAFAPGPGAQAVPGRGEGAVASAEGATVEVRLDAWTGRPKELGDVVTPVLVKIENHGTQAIRIRYDDFALIAGDGKQYAAVPVFDVGGSVVHSSDRLIAPPDGFLIAPYLSPYYPWLSPYDGPFAYDPFYYDTYVPTLKRIELPTADMVSMALPEGVVKPTGRVAGFLYFQRIDPKVDRVTFRARLTAARENQQIAVVTILFVAKG